MKSFFIITSLAILVLIELMIGTWGIFYPIVSLGLLYVAKHNNIIVNLVIAIILGIVINLLLGTKHFLITPICYTLLIISTSREEKNSISSLFTAGLIGGIVFVIFNLIYGVTNLIFSNEFTGKLTAFISIILLSAPAGFITNIILISVLDSLAKKFKIQTFIQVENLQNNIYDFKRRGSRNG